MFHLRNMVLCLVWFASMNNVSICAAVTCDLMPVPCHNVMHEAHNALDCVIHIHPCTTITHTGTFNRLSTTSTITAH